MCGRFTRRNSLVEICAAFCVSTNLEPREPNYNAAPESTHPVIIRDRMGEALWGWPSMMPGIKPFTNIRVETAGKKPSFAQSWQMGRRCLIPASGFYEWDGAGQPFYVEDRHNPIISFCGLWTKDDEGAVRFGILTREAMPVLAHIHPRMPLAATPETAASWLQSGQLPPVPGFEAYPVSTQVNIVANNGPELLEPLPAAPQGSLFAVG